MPHLDPMNPLKKFFEGDPRTVKTRKNMLVTGFFKGADMLVYLLVVPLTLGYVNPYEYGVWLTLNSFLLWIDYFDIGLGSGLRNKLATAMAADDRQKAREYVSTTLFMLMALGLVLFGLFSLLVHLLDWHSLLNIDAATVPDLRQVIWVSLAFFTLNFVLKFVGSVWQALQLPAVAAGITFSGHLLSMLIIFVLTLTLRPGSLMLIALAYSAGPPLVYALAYPVTFKKALRYLSPSPRFFRTSCLKDLLSLSVLFFLLQAAALILFATSSFVISRMFGPEEVTPYNIAYRFFSIVPFVMNIVMTPMWSASTDAWARGDLSWIARTNRNIRKILWLMCGGVVLMVLLSGWIYRLWIGEEVTIGFALSAFMGLYVLITTWSTSYSSFLNGISFLRLQSFHTVFAAAVFLPLCMGLGGRLGVTGIVVSMCLVHLPGAVLNTIQFHKVLGGRAKGIWSK